MSFFAAATADLNLFRCWKVPNYNSRQCRGRVAPTSQTGCVVRDSVPEPCEGRKKTEMTNRSDPLRPAGLGMFVAYSILSALRECRPRMGEIKIRAVRRLAAMAILMRRTLVCRGADL
jgi:hypothetical protein